MASNEVYKRDQVVKIINSVLGKIQTPNSAPNHVIEQELTELKDAIDSLRGQLGSSKANDINKVHIPTSADELDAVVDMTEQASQSIMAACENILQTIQGEDTEISKAVEAQVVSIFEACTFQDITGQRIKKVLDALKQIEQKSAHILQILGDALTDIENQDENDEGDDNVVSLLNGPALPENAMSQADIDKLLLEFDDKDT